MLRDLIDTGRRRRARFGAALALSLLVGALGLQTAFADTQTITFDDAQGNSVGHELDGQLPAGVIDWGSGTWYLSGPWQALSANSVSFNGEGISSGSFTFVTPRQLVRVDAYNGDDDNPATVTLSCPGQADKQVQLNADELRTVDTGWTGTCSNVTISVSNGWQTNFDNLVVQ